MYRFFTSPKDVSGNKIYINREQARHAFSVLRLRPKDRVCIFDGTGKQYFGTIKSLSARRGIISINRTEFTKENKIKITLAAAIPKHFKFDSIVDKATQLGAFKIVPLITERTIVRLSAIKMDAKISRWKKIAIEAAKQSNRIYVPEISSIYNFADFVEQIPDFGFAIIAHLGKDALSLKRVLGGKTPKDVLVFVGPEGDFTEQEVKTAESNGAICVSLGENVLRCDTAVNMILSILNYEWEN